MTAGIEASSRLWLYCATTRPGNTASFGITNRATAWLVVTRNTVTHEITKVELARDVAKAWGAANEPVEPH
jgi:sarcosine oxidase delta subunit